MSAQHRQGRLVVAVVAAAFAASACSRNNIEAVNLANEGDQAKGSNIDEAISKYEQATKLDPDNARIWWKLALAYEKKEDWQKMASACTKAEEAAEKADKKKTHADYYFRQGYALEQLAEKGAGQLGRREGAVPDGHPARPELRAGLRRARRGSSSTPTTRRARSRTGRRRSR